MNFKNLEKCEILKKNRKKIYFSQNFSSFSSLVQSLHPKGYPFKNIFDFTTAGDCDCVAAVERLPALHFSVNFISLFFGIMGFIVKL